MTIAYRALKQVKTVIQVYFFHYFKEIETIFFFFDWTTNFWSLMFLERFFFYFIFVIVGEFVMKDGKYWDALKVCKSITGFHIAQRDLHCQWLLDGFTVTDPSYSLLAQGYSSSRYSWYKGYKSVLYN